MKKRVTYRPSKAQGTLSGVVGIVFVLIGLFIAIPQFGLFGIFWTAIAVGITVVNLKQAFGKDYVGPEIHIEDEAVEAQDTPEVRMKQLRALYDQRLITPEEYESKRQEILKEL